MDNNKPLISIIVPIYNLESLMSDCIESVLAQTYGNLEVILVDDGSADRSGEIADSFAEKDSRVKVIHQPNGGVTRARFAGMRQASGEWIGFVDGDDYIEPQMYERLLENALTYGADISHCGYQMVFFNRVDYYYNTGRLAEQDGPTGLYDLLDGSFVEPGLCNKLFHKTLLHSLFHSGVEEQGIRINEDLLMNYYLFSAANKSVFEDVCPYHYLVRGDSAANATPKPHHFLDPERVGEILVRETAGNPALESAAYRLYVRRIMLTVMQKSFPELASASKQKLKKLIGDKKLVALPKKERYMALSAAYCLPLYRLVRFVYERVTGIDRKYVTE